MSATAKAAALSQNGCMSSESVDGETSILFRCPTLAHGVRAGRPALRARGGGRRRGAAFPLRGRALQCRGRARPGRDLAVLRQEGRERQWAFRAPDGGELARVTPGEVGWRVDFSQEVEHDPFAKMLLLAAVLSGPGLAL